MPIILSTNHQGCDCAVTSGVVPGPSPVAPVARDEAQHSRVAAYKYDELIAISVQKKKNGILYITIILGGFNWEIRVK